MLKQKSSRLKVAVGTAAVLIIAAGGAALASNMAFKFNRPLVANPAGGPFNEAKHWTSIPYFNPYLTGCTTAAGVSCAGAFCRDTGLPVGPPATTITRRVGAGFLTATCGLAAANGFALPAGESVQINMPTGFAGGSIIIVGSHNPSLEIVVPDSNPVAGAAPIKFWFAVPYHTTAVTSRDLCLSSGLSSAVGAPAATITRLNPSGGNFVPTSCTVTPGQTLILGEGYEITEPGGPKTFRPAHF